MDVNDIKGDIIKAAVTVHKELGPGLLESVYQRCMLIELVEMGHTVAAELPVPIRYRGRVVHDEGFRIDILVDDAVVVELKSVSILKPVHKKQLLTYLRLYDRRVGLLINFNECLLKQGIVRVVNGLPESPRTS